MSDGRFFSLVFLCFVRTRAVEIGVDSDTHQYKSISRDLYLLVGWSVGILRVLYLIYDDYSDGDGDGGKVTSCCIAIRSS